MNTRTQNILNITLSVMSALNEYFVHSEMSDKLFDPHDPNYRVISIIFTLVNFLAMPPEYIYSIKRNAYLSETFREIKGEDEKEKPRASKNKGKRDQRSRSIRWAVSAPHISLDSYQFDQAESHLFSESGHVCALEIEEREAKNAAPVLRNIFAGGAILAMGLPVAVGHYVLFYDATEKMFIERYTDDFFNTKEPTTFYTGPMWKKQDPALSRRRRYYRSLAKRQHHLS